MMTCLGEKPGAKGEGRKPKEMVPANSFATKHHRTGVARS